MSLVIDGYNLMHAAGIIGRGAGPGGLERSRLALLNFIVESLDPADLPQAVVVFDAAAAPPGLPRSLVHRGLTVRFAAKYESADELIEELIELDSAPRRLIVVSSDHRLHRAARRRKATAIDSDVWHAQTVQKRRQRNQASPAQTPLKPSAPLAESEIELGCAVLRLTCEPVADGPNADRPNAVARNRAPGATDAKATDAKPPLPAIDSDAIFPPGYGEDLEE
jgi:predicted RNA-binding protein with PIN domain